MKKNMIDWKNSIIASHEVKAIPLMTYPGLAILGNNILEMVTSGEVHFNCVKALSDRYPAMAFAPLVMALYVEAEAFGCEIKYCQNEIPSISNRFISSFNSLENIRIPEIGSGKTGEYIQAARLASKKITDRPVFAGIIGPYSLAGRLYGVTEMMSAILSEPEKSKKLLQICTDFLKNYAQAFKDTGVNGIIIAEPSAGLLAGNECESFSSFYVKQIVDLVQDENFIVVLHNCGNTVTLLNSMVSTGCMGFHFGNAVDMAVILPGIPSDRLVFGNLDPVGVFKNGTPEFIKATTLELLMKTAGFKNFVLSSGCDIPPETKLENIDAFFNAIGEYNRNHLQSIKSGHTNSSQLEFSESNYSA